MFPAGVLMATCATAFAQVQAIPFLDDSTVQVINITMDPNDWATLQQNYLLNTYYHAAFTWNGIAENVGIRSHGGAAAVPSSPTWISISPTTLRPRRFSACLLFSSRRTMKTRPTCVNGSP